jgi:hypothetical protein
MPPWPSGPQAIRRPDGRRRCLNPWHPRPPPAPRRPCPAPQKHRGLYAVTTVDTSRAGARHAFCYPSPRPPRPARPAGGTAQSPRCWPAVPAPGQPLSRLAETPMIHRRRALAPPLRRAGQLLPGRRQAQPEPDQCGPQRVEHRRRDASFSRIQVPGDSGEMRSKEGRLSRNALPTRCVSTGPGGLAAGRGAAASKATASSALKTGAGKVRAAFPCIG